MSGCSRRSFRFVEMFHLSVPAVSGRVKFQTEADATNPNVFKASFNVFDLIPAGAQSHLLELTLTIDGSERTTTVDISDDVLKELEKGDFTYDLPLALHIKVTHTIEGDIQASVEGWDDSGSGSAVRAVIEALTVTWE